MKKRLGASLIVAFAACFAAGCIPSSFLITPVTSANALDEKIVRREGLLVTRRIALIDIDGLIQNASTSSLFGGTSENPASFFVEKLDRAAKDDRVHAVVLRINSPGGAVTASDLMYEELQRFRADTGKPVIASMLDVAASGGYYIACASDQIYAMPTTVTGSIGVIMLLPNFARGLEKIGIHVRAIKSGNMKDAGSPFRALDEAAQSRFQSMVDQMYARFVEVVHRGRPKIATEKLRALADGRVFLGAEALENGLVDKLGGPEDAITAAKVASGSQADAPFVIVQYARPYGYKPTVYASSGAVQQNNLINIENPMLLTAPQFLYLWSPN